jgi:hypothetical protein
VAASENSLDYLNAKTAYVTFDCMLGTTLPGGTVGVLVKSQ